MKIRLEHLNRIEGHARLVIDTEKRELTECHLEVFEAPRFFEAILRGQPAADVAPLVARICGICSHSHSIVSLMATEDALGIEVSRQTTRLRELLLYGEMIQSHLVQLFFMAAPDYLQIDSLFTPSARPLLDRALRLKGVGTELCRVIGGRAVHPLSPCIGGFAQLPTNRQLRDLRESLVTGLADLERAVELFAGFVLPVAGRPARWLRIAGDGFPVAGRVLESDRGDRFGIEKFRERVEEYLVPHSHAKHATLDGENFRVGPLVRMHGREGNLSPMARTAAKALGTSFEGHNPYAAVPARLIEVIHVTETAIHRIDELLMNGLKTELLPRPDAGGQGVAVVEAPRGLLLHSYSYDSSGRLEHADCVIPTAQNLAAIEADLHHLTPTLLDQGEEVLRHRMETLVRSYDPCISCSTHLLRIDLRNCR